MFPICSLYALGIFLFRVSAAGDLPPCRRGAGHRRRLIVAARLGRRTCAPATCWSYQNVAYDASSEMVSRVTGLPYEQAVRRYLFNPIGMTSGSVSMAGLQSNKSWAKPHTAGRRPEPIVDTYYKVPGAAGINSNIKDMALWM